MDVLLLFQSADRRLRITTTTTAPATITNNTPSIAAIPSVLDAAIGASAD
jgi:hypothetical protein